MLVNPPEELDAPSSTPASTPSSNCSPFTTDNENILRLVKAIGYLFPMKRWAFILPLIVRFAFLVRISVCENVR